MALWSEGKYKAEYRRLKQMKIKGSDDPQPAAASEQTLKNCSAELGLMVQEEAFDTWYGKETIWYGRFFVKMPLTQSRGRGYLVRLRLRTMVERVKRRTKTNQDFRCA